MRIAFIGNFEAQFSTENYHKQAFERLGHQVITFQENKTNVEEILPIAKDCDMLFWTHTHGWNIGSDSETNRLLIEMKLHNVPTVGYHLDLWLGLDRERDLYRDPYWSIEHFFTVDKLMADWLNDNTSTKGYFLPAGVSESNCYIAKSNREKYPHEIIFLGSKGYHREYPYRVDLIDCLHNTYGDKFAHYGGGGRPQVRGDELNVLISSARIVIGDTLCKDFTYPWYSSDRLFECCGRGAFMIYPNIQGLETFYEDKKEIVFYQNGDLWDLTTKINEYIENDWVRAQISNNAVNRTKSEHTYTHRLEHIIKTLGLKNG